MAKKYIRIEVSPQEFNTWTKYAKSYVNIKTKTNLIRYAVEQYILNDPSKSTGHAAWLFEGIFFI